MKKIGIVTLNGEHNYGNRLQNYALQKSISNLGHSSETIVFRMLKTSVIRLIKDTLIKISPLRHKRLDYWRMLKTKSAVFQPFSQTNIKTYTASAKNKPVISDRYDLFITGSDQVWNPNYTKGSSINFLSFAPSEKRTSYAASFGVSEIPVEYRDLYTLYLNNIQTISVREQAGAEIVKNLTGRDAKLVPDPTILLDSNDWSELIKDYDHLADERYLIVYSLHNLDEDTWSQIYHHANANNLKIYQVMGDFYDQKHETPSPDEFVARIKYASAVYTDSFHACVFSIIMHTPFKVFERKDMKMSSRLETLLSTYGMKIAMQKGEINADSYNFEQSDKIAIKERQRGMRYLSRIISNRNVN